MNPGKLRLRTLGSFCIVDPPTVAATRLGVKERALIGYLAAKIHVAVQREEVSALLWGNVDDRRARHSLSQSLSTINKALPAWIMADRSTLKLTIPHDTIDLYYVHSLLRKENIVSACEQLAGRFLADVTVDSEEFADWKDAFDFDLYSNIEVRALSILSNVRSLPLEERYALVRRLVELIPFSESLPVLESRLASELRQLALARQETDTGVKEAGPLRFVGREIELRTLMSAWTRSQNGEGQFVLVEGNAGIGKTRLLDEFVLRALPNCRTIKVRCYEPERHIGLNVVVDLIQHLVNEDILSRIPEVLAAALADVVGRDSKAKCSLPELSTIGSQRRLFEAVFCVLRLHISTKPLLLCFDDLQWADASTLAFIHLLSRRIRTSRAMVIIAARPSRRLKSFRDASITRLRLSDLSSEDVAHLKSDPQLPVACSQSSTERLLRLTAGNPFLLTEYLRTYEGEGFTGVRRMLSSHSTRDFIRALVSGLHPSATRLMSALAVAGRPIAGEMLRHIAQLSPERFTDAMHQLLSSRIIAPGRLVSFRHDLIREGVYRRIPKLRRRLLHHRIAELLRKQGANHGAVARHFYLAAQQPTAHEYALLAVASADARSALNEGMSFLKLAIRTAPNRKVRANLHREMAHRSFRLRRYRDAFHHIHQALELPFGLSRTEKAGLTLLELEILVTLGRISTDELLKYLAEFELAHSEILHQHLRYEVLRLVIRSAAIEGDKDRCSLYAGRMVQFARNAHPLTCAQGLSIAARSHSFTTSSMDALPWAEEAERQLQPDASPEAAAEVLTNVGSVYSEAGEYERALNLYNTALGLIRAAGALHIWPRTATHKHMLLVEMGRFDEARDLACEISAAWNDEDAQQHIATLEGNVALMYFHLGDYLNTLLHANKSLSSAQDFGMYSHRLTATALVGLAELELGHLSEANRHANSLISQIGVSPRRLGDYSFIEIFLARWNMKHRRTDIAIADLNSAMCDCAGRDVAGFLRIKLELARALRKVDTSRAEIIASEVTDTARRIGAQPISDDGAFLLGRLRKGTD